MAHALAIPSNMEVRYGSIFRCLGDQLIFIGARKRLIGLHGILVGIGEILGKLPAPIILSCR